MPSSQFRRRGLIAIVAVALVATGGLAYAAIPDAGGVIHACYTKSSGAWRVIDPGAGQACKAREAALDLYSKGGADARFLDALEADGRYLGKTETAADSDKLDGQDSSAFLGTTATAADSSALGGFPSWRWVFGGGFHLGDGFTIADGGVQTFDCCDPVDTTPSINFEWSCDTGGGTTFVVSSATSFHWWWDETSGDATAVAGGYEVEFAIGNGTERHSLRALMFTGGTNTKLDLDTSIGSNCLIAWTMSKTPILTPGP